MAMAEVGVMFQVPGFVLALFYVNALETNDVPRVLRNSRERVYAKTFFFFSKAAWVHRTRRTPGTTIRVQLLILFHVEEGT